jgi:hypothetical protein
LTTAQDGGKCVSLMHWPHLPPGLISIRRYNRMYTTIGTYCSFYMPVCSPGWVGSNPARTIDSHLTRTMSTNCYIHTVVPPVDGLQIRPKHVEVLGKIHGR